MKRKNILALLLTCVMVLSLAACSGGAQPAGSSTNAASGTSSSAPVETDTAAADTDFSGKTLTIGIWGGNESETAALDKLKQVFEEKTGAKVEFKIYTDVNTQLQADLIGKTAPDMFYIEAFVFPFYSSLGVLEPLDRAEMQADRFYKPLIDAFTGTDGNLYAVPKDVSTLATYINTDLFESVGVSPDDIPAALEDYKDFLVDLQSKLDEKHGKGQVAAMTYNREITRSLYVLESNGAQITDADGKSTMSSDGVVNNMQFIVDLVQTGAMKTPKDLGLGWNGEAFGVGKVAIMEEGNWVYRNLQNEYPDINFTVKEMPTYAGKQGSMSFTVGYGIYALSQEKDLAKEWIKFATGLEGMPIWTDGAGCLPSRGDVAEAMKITDDPVWAVHDKMTAIATPWQKGITLAIINDTFNNFAPAAYMAEQSVKDVMTQIDNQANQQIENS